MGVSGGAVTTLMIGTTVANGWGTGVGTEGAGETTVDTRPAGSGRGESGEATAADGTATGRDSDEEGRVTKEMVEVGGVTLGWEEEEGQKKEEEKA